MEDIYPRNIWSGYKNLTGNKYALVNLFGAIFYLALSFLTLYSFAEFYFFLHRQLVRFSRRQTLCPQFYIPLFNGGFVLFALISVPKFAWKPILKLGAKLPKTYKIQGRAQHLLDVWEKRQEEVRTTEKGRLNITMIEIGQILIEICKYAAAEIGLPLWNRLTRSTEKIIGQPLITHALRQRINPFRKTNYQSSNTNNATESVRLGWTGWSNPIYSKKK